MSKGISTDSTISLSVAMLIKVGFLIAIVTGSWYQAQMKFAEQETRIKNLEDKVVVLNASIEGMEQEHIQQLEQTVQEQKSLLQKIGLKR
jgi:hypothetical protein|tara:strand:+ start:95 stop:364 length:270 start_codon:yes stop_codon:yes gene_type:complete